MASNALKELVGENICRDFFEYDEAVATLPELEQDIYRDFFEALAAATEPQLEPVAATEPQLEPVSDPFLTPAPPSLTLDDAELELFVDAQRNQNTKRKTKSDLGKWYRWCESTGEKRPIGEIPLGELDRLLGHFYCKVRKENGELLEPDTLTSIQRSLDRHLTKELHNTLSIIHDTEFAPSNEILKATRKMLKKEGKGNKPNAAEASQLLGQTQSQNDASGLTLTL